MDSQELRSLQEAYLDIYTEERAPGVRPYNPGPPQSEVRADAERAAKKKKDKDKDKPGYGPEEKFKDWKLTSTPSTVSKTGETISQRMDKEAPYKTRPFSPLFTKQGSRTASAVTRATEGPGEPQSVTMPRMKSKPSREIVRRRKQEESVDLYDVILSHLLDEGYADTQEQAEAIMVNMSEEWREDIVEEVLDEKYKDRPVSKMAKQARRIAFSYGTEVNSDEDSEGNVPHSNPKKALAKMARFGGKKVKQHIKKGYEQGSQYDPYYQELNSRNPSRNKWS